MKSLKFVFVILFICGLFIYQNEWNVILQYTTNHREFLKQSYRNDVSEQLSSFRNCWPLCVFRNVDTISNLRSIFWLYQVITRSHKTNAFAEFFTSIIPIIFFKTEKYPDLKTLFRTNRLGIVFCYRSNCDFSHFWGSLANSIRHIT